MTISPPREKGPPLNALRAFEAAARHGGFSDAAEELCVTPGAVAQQIKLLEAWVGAPLFDRHAQGVTLTSLGADVMPEFVAAFDRLGEAVQALRAQAAPDEIKIAALPSIAQLWLSPRLPAVRSHAKDFTISISALENPPNLKREQFDLSIFFADQVEGNMIEVCEDMIFPVCSPSLATQLHYPTDLVNVICLHDTTWSQDWNLWIKAASPDKTFDTRGPVFSLYSLALEEAKNGAGVLIGHEPLVRSYLEAGTLVAPFGTAVTLNSKLVISSARPLIPNTPMERIVTMLSNEI